MWNHKEINQADCSSNGEVTSIVYLKNYIFSGHSDGTLKVVTPSQTLKFTISSTTSWFPFQFHNKF
jgi:hypothetical protein